MDGLWTEARGQQKQSNDPGNNQHNLNTPTIGLRKRGNDTSKSTGRSGRQNAATRRNMRREDRVTVQGPVKKQQLDGMSHGGGADAFRNGQQPSSRRAKGVAPLRALCKASGAAPPVPPPSHAGDPRAKAAFGSEPSRNGGLCTGHPPPRRSWRRQRSRGGSLSDGGEPSCKGTCGFP